MIFQGECWTPTSLLNPLISTTFIWLTQLSMCPYCVFLHFFCFTYIFQVLQTFLIFTVVMGTEILITSKPFKNVHNFHLPNNAKWPILKKKILLHNQTYGKSLIHRMELALPNSRRIMVKLQLHSKIFCLSGKCKIKRHYTPALKKGRLYWSVVRHSVCKSVRLLSHPTNGPSQFCFCSISSEQIDINFV